MKSMILARSSAGLLCLAAATLLAAQVPTGELRLPASRQLGDPIKTELDNFRLSLVHDKLDSPWSLAFLPDGRALITERKGSLLLLDERGVKPVAGVPPVMASGQGGLLDLALHPRFGENRLVFFSYSAAGPEGATTAVFRARFQEGPAGPSLTEGRTIWEGKRKSRSTIHFGSRLAFGNDGMLYISTGERGDAEQARNLSEAQGKILRLEPEGGIPPDNPFRSRPGALPEIFSLGHRNPQGLALNPADGRIWSHEHGPMGGDEVNIIEAGADYGWPFVSYGRAYSGGKIGEGSSKPGIKEPLLYWVPSIAPSGMAFYAGRAFPGWAGDLFIGALAGEELRRVDLVGGRVQGQETLLKGAIGRIRDVRLGPDGLLYLLTEGAKPALYRLEPAL